LGKINVDIKIKRKYNNYMSANDGYYLMIDAKKLWLADNPGKQDRDFFREGIDVQDEYTEKAGGKKIRYLGAGAWVWER
jgi:hypothetical protein